MQTPIALFTYNRPDHTRRVLTALKHCARLDECIVHIYCDGPKRPEHAPMVEASRCVVREWVRQENAKVIERTENFGLAKSIVTGVTELCNEYGRVIVLEDDLIVSADFVDYLLQSLDYYANTANVYQITGYMYPIQVTTPAQTFFLPLVSTWGWATWRRAWQTFDWNALNALEFLSKSNNRFRFDLDDSYPYSKMLKQWLAGKNHSWGILWWYSVFCQNGLVLYPRNSLVENIGFDGSGTHGEKRHAAMPNIQNDIQQAKLESPVSFPQAVQVDGETFSSLKKFLKHQTQGRGVFRIWRKFRIIIQDLLT